MIVDFMVMKRFENNYIVFEWSNAAVDKLAEIDIDQVVKKLASFSQPPVINVGGKNISITCNITITCINITITCIFEQDLMMQT